MIEKVAKHCHEMNKMFCEATGDFSQPSWEDAPEWQKNSAINGVIFHMNNPNVTPEQSHENWMKEKVADGWVYGPVKDVEKKQHPCMMPYNELPPDQRFKDTLFKMSIVVALANESGA